MNGSSGGGGQTSGTGPVAMPSGSGGAEAGSSSGGHADAGGSVNVAGTNAGAPARGTPFVYVGSGFYDLAEPRLHVFRLSSDTGELAAVQELPADAYPSFMAAPPGGRHLYVNVENSPGSASAYAIESGTGRLTFLNDLPSGGDGSAYVSTNASGKFALQVNYESGSVVTVSLRADGALGQVVDEHDLGGQAAHPHSVVVDPTDRFAFVPCRWDPAAPGNYIAQFEFDATTGVLTPNEPFKVELPFGTGPRHLAFHPNGKFAYVDNERNSTVSVYAYDAEQGTLSRLQDITTLPNGFSGSNAPADMRIHPSGKFLYVANRGQHSLAMFGIDGSSGELSVLGHETFEGQPRNLFVDPDGHFLVVGDLGGNKVRLYLIDQQTGALSAWGTPASVSSPSGLAVVYVQGT